MVQTVEKKADFWNYAEQFKGNKVMELKCQIICIRIQATRYATLKEDRETNSGRGLSPFETPKDEQEWKALCKTCKAYAMGAKTGDPKDMAQLCAWEEAEQGSIPLKQLLKVYNTALSRVQKQMHAHEKDPDNCQEPEMEADLDDNR